MSYLPMIFVIAAATLAARVGGFHLARRSLPPTFDRFLAWVAVAAFAALAVPDIVDGPGTVPGRVLGAIAAAVVVGRSLPYWAALLSGMVVFWAIGAVA